METQTATVFPGSKVDDEPLLVDANRAMVMLSVGRTTFYNLVNAGELDTFLIGKARRITVASIRSYIQRKLNTEWRIDCNKQPQSHGSPRAHRHVGCRYRLPAVYPARVYVTSGGLMSYGIDPVDPYRGAASYVNRILRGEKPEDMPVQQPTKFEFVVNLKAASALGLTLSLPLIGRTDEVIE